MIISDLIGVGLPRRCCTSQRCLLDVSSTFQLLRFHMELSLPHLLPPPSPCYEILSVDQWRTCLLNPETEGVVALRQSRGCVVVLNPVPLQGLCLPPGVSRTQPVCSVAPSSSCLTFSTHRAPADGGSACTSPASRVKRLVVGLS